MMQPKGYVRVVAPVIIAVLGGVAVAAFGSTDHLPAGTPGVEAQLVSLGQPVRTETTDARVAPLAAYVETAMHKWAPPDKLSADYVEIAIQIAVTVLDEEPVWNDDASRSHTAILLASLAFWESRFRAYVDLHECNERDFAKHHPLAFLGNCDGGWAVSVWQIHPAELCKAKDETGFCVYEHVTKAKLFDRAYAAKTALWLARRSVRGSGGLCGYSGEMGDCPKARLRLDFARNWSRVHPYAETTYSP